MRLGGPIFDTNSDPEALVAYHQEHGFSAAFMRHDHDKVRRDEICAAYAEANILPAELGAYRHNVLDTNPDKREAFIDEICRRLEYADEAGILCCVIHGGSYETGSWGSPNPDNFGEQAFDETVEAIRNILERVKPRRTKLVIETEKYVFPNEPDLYIRLIKAIDHPQFGVHLDPINMIFSPKRLYENGQYLKQCFEILGPHIVSCHSKDLTTTDTYPHHIIETYTGNGWLDHDVYLTELAKLHDDVPLMIEHLTAEQLPMARDHLFAKTKKLGLCFVRPTAKSR